MAWGNQGINHYVYGAGSWSVYYWNSSYNPGATFQLCMANCTTYAYGRVRENGLPAPVTQFRNANNWHYYVNTSANWTLLNYTSGMQLKQGDILEWSAVHVAVVESNGTDPWVSGSWYTGDDGTAASDRSYLGMGGSTLQDVSNWMVANASWRFYRYERMTSVNSTAGGGAYPVYVLRYTGSTPPGPTPTTTPSVTVSPASASGTMTSSQTYTDFNFTITVTGILESEDASDAISFSANCYRYMYTTGWVYTTYTSGGVTYRQGVRSLIVRYPRAHDYAYTDTAYMYYRKSFVNGSVNSSTPIYMTIQASESGDDVTLFASILKKRRKKKFEVKIY